MNVKVRHAQLSMQLAMGRIRMRYINIYCGITAIGLTRAYYKNSNSKFLLPLFPMSFVLHYLNSLYNGDMLL